MLIIEKKLSELKPYPNNPKKHPKEQINEIAESIKLTKGLKQPIVIDSNDYIVVGHGRYLAAKQLKFKTVPCVYADNMTDEEIRAYRLIDNELSKHSDIDLDLQTIEIQEIDFDFEPFGLDMFDMDDIQEVEVFNEDDNDKEFFSTAFVFPAARKKQIMAYLRKHKDEITQDIIDKSGVILWERVQRVQAVAA